MTSRSNSWANFLQFYGFGEEVVSDESQISLAYSSWWHQVAQEVKGFVCHPCRSRFKLMASHCCDESVGLSLHGMWLRSCAGVTCSPRTRQWGCSSQEPCFQQSEELSQRLNHNRGGLGAWVLRSLTIPERGTVVWRSQSQGGEGPSGSQQV